MEVTITHIVLCSELMWTCTQSGNDLLHLESIFVFVLGCSTDGHVGVSMVDFEVIPYRPP